jgi:steroid 5-alpha reductase family enzyme
MNIILFALIVSIGINLAMFVPAFIYKTDKITDISYAVTFAVVATAGYLRSTHELLHKIVLFLVLVWAARLGTFLFIRINKIGKDVRFDGMREKFFAFLQFWLLQGATVFVVMLAPLCVFQQKSVSVSAVAVIGAILFLLGVLLEATADAQKFRFNSDPSKKGSWIDEGIWRISRHPNYLGEMAVWTGMYIVATTVLSGISLFISALSPLFIYSLLLFVSGIPLLEKSATKRWGTDKKYIEYKLKVPVLIPSINSIKRIVEG